MELLVKLLTVFGLGAVELWAAIPVGFALKLPPSVIAVTAASGAMLGSFIILNIGEKIRSRLCTPDKRNKYMHGIYNRYGVAGLGLLAPLLIGAPLGTVLGIAIGLPATRLFFWMGLGIIVCSVGLTMATEFGLKIVWNFLQVLIFSPIFRT